MPSEVILPSAFFPPIAYFTALKDNRCIIDIYESFPKQTIRNRLFIASANGILKLSIPIEKYPNHTLTKDIRLQESNEGATTIWRSLESAYNRSAYFEYYKDELKDKIFKKNDFLIDYNQEILAWLLSKLKLRADIEYSSDYIPSSGIESRDMRGQLSYKTPPSTGDGFNYFQVFEDKLGFIPNLSILDLLFSQGPESSSYF